MNLVIIGPGNGLSPGRRQAITWTNAGLLSIGPLRTSFSAIRIEIQVFIDENAFENIVCEMADILSKGRWANSGLSVVWWCLQSYCQRRLAQVLPLLISGRYPLNVNRSGRSPTKIVP